MAAAGARSRSGRRSARRSSTRAASVPGTFAFDPPAGTVLQPGTHTLSATFTPASTADYVTGSVTTQLVVGFTAPCIASTRTGPLRVAAGQSLCVTGRR